MDIFIYYFYYTLCARPILWILGLHPYVFYYPVISILDSNERIVHRNWLNVLMELLIFVFYPIDIVYYKYDSVI